MCARREHEHASRARALLILQPPPLRIMPDLAYSTQSAASISWCDTVGFVKTVQRGIQRTIVFLENLQLMQHSIGM